MQIVWRTLPKLALPAAIGLGVAYLATSFVARPAPSLRPPEELRAQGQAFGEESPVRIILERNVLKLESPLFYPLGQPPVPVAPPQTTAPETVAKPSASPPASAQAAFAQADASVAPQAAPGPVSPPQAAASVQVGVSAPLSGGPSVQGLAVSPAGPAPASAALVPGAPLEPRPGSPAGPTQTPASSMQMPAGQGAPPAAKAPAAPQTRPQAQVPAPAPQAPAPAPEAKSPAGQAAPRLGLEGFRLVGVIAGSSRPLAMLLVDGAAVTLGLGEQARGWTLVSVEQGQVLLKSGEQLRRLELGGPVPAQSPKAP
jgi:hypothetical protein